MLEDKFKLEIEKYKKENEKYIRQFNIVGYLRLIVFITAVVPVYRYIRYKTVSVIGFIIPIVFFIALVIYQRKVKEKQKYIEEMIIINEDYIKRIKGSWRNFKDGGEEFIDSGHQYSSDLDLFGEGSLFKLINVTNTFFGRQKLAYSMLNRPNSADEIIKRQKAVAELSSKLEFCEKVQYAGMNKKIKENSTKKLLDYMKSDTKIVKDDILKKIIYILPMVFIPVAAGIIVFRLTALSWVIGVFIIINIILWTWKAGKTAGILNEVEGIRDNMCSYMNIINVVSEEEFESDILRDIKSSLTDSSSSAKESIKKLYNIAERINMRNGGFQYFLLNLLFLWDYQCVFSLEKWKVDYGSRIYGYLDSIGCLEELISISVLSHINENTAWPKIVDTGKCIKAEELGHILIDSSERVCNDVNMDNDILIITGSNMSGKTTYLRTIGINLVISYLGGVVCADSFEAPILDIYTSMRISDDLKSGISTFYGELIRIQKIIERAKEDGNFLFLIDEVFRGTNSKDRIIGAEAVLINLERAGAIGSITTHDLEICSVSGIKRVKNYHFQEFYKDDKIYFDYKIREGISTTTNAKFLMKMIGIKL